MFAMGLEKEPSLAQKLAQSRKFHFYVFIGFFEYFFRQTHLLYYLVRLPVIRRIKPTISKVSPNWRKSFSSTDSQRHLLYDNRKRFHSALNFKSPMDFDRNSTKNTNAPCIHSLSTKLRQGRGLFCGEHTTGMLTFIKYKPND